MPGSLYERERERALVVEALDEVADGRGRAVVLEGPAGIGKMSLLGLARDAALERSFAVASARGTELERAYAWGVVRSSSSRGCAGCRPARAAPRSPAGAGAIGPGRRYAGGSPAAWSPAGRRPAARKRATSQGTRDRA